MALIINQVKPDAPTVKLVDEKATAINSDITKLSASALITSLVYRLNQHQDALRSAQQQPSGQLYIDQAKDAEKKVKEISAELDRRFPLT